MVRLLVAECTWRIAGNYASMSQLGDLGRDTAYYFGFGRGSERMRAARRDEPTWLTVTVSVVPILIATFGLARLLGIRGDLVGIVVELGLLVATTVVWGLLLRLLRGRSGLRPPRG